MTLLYFPRRGFSVFYETDEQRDEVAISFQPRCCGHLSPEKLSIIPQLRGMGNGCGEGSPLHAGADSGLARQVWLRTVPRASAVQLVLPRWFNTSSSNFHDFCRVAEVSCHSPLQSLDSGPGRSDISKTPSHRAFVPVALYPSFSPARQILPIPSCPAHVFGLQRGSSSRHLHFPLPTSPPPPRHSPTIDRV
jgi:hypothetical protein